MACLAAMSPALSSAALFTGTLSVGPEAWAKPQEHIAQPGDKREASWYSQENHIGCYRVCQVSLIYTNYDNLTVFLGIWMNALKITERNQGMHLPGKKDLLTANFIFSWSCHVSNFGPRRLEIWMPLFLASCFLQPCNHPLHECLWHFTIITYLPPSLRIYLPRPSYRPHFLQVFSAWKTSLAFLWSKL